jgi:hypothetical protein
MTTTVYEDQARKIKASALASLSIGKQATASQIANLDDEGWAAAEKLAGVRPASAKTRELVVSVLKGLEAAGTRWVDDPFAGLPREAHTHKWKWITGEEGFCLCGAEINDGQVQ